MWICLVSNAKGMPTKERRLEILRDEVNASGDGRSGRLILPRKARGQLAAARPNDPLIFGSHSRGRWQVHGQGRIAGAVVIESIKAAAGAASIEVCVCPLNNVALYMPPRGEADFAIPAQDWPRSGRTHATWLERPETGIGQLLARSTIPRALVNSDQRRAAGVPQGDDEPGLYIIELNVSHLGGMVGAAADFERLYGAVISGSTGQGTRPAPVRIAKSYYRCTLSVTDWLRLVAEDRRRAQEAMKEGTSGSGLEHFRCIHKLWPDFEVKALVDHSVSTIKADAARRTFESTGEGIVWAVLDSGVAADHPHFGEDGRSHALRSHDVADLHRSFVDEVVDLNGVPTVRGVIAMPEADQSLTTDQRRALIDRHRAAALADEFGHGTHVAGIIAGPGPAASRTPVRVFEQQYRADEGGSGAAHTYGIRQVDPSRLGGIAPRCKLVSLRVLDAKGKGRSSDLILALEYIRDSLNNNPSKMIVHGVNMSLGYEFDAAMYACGQSPLCVVVDRLVQSGVVVVVAAGNTGYGSVSAQVGSSKVGLSNTINDPGNAAGAITVGATHRDSPHTYGVSFFSSKGPTGDGRLKPDLVAPGERITSCAAGTKLQAALTATGLAAPTPDSPSADYVDDSGTSMAAPHVSGAVAAFLSIRREYIGNPREVTRIFLNSATPLGRERYFEGHGLVDLMRAIQSV